VRQPGDWPREPASTIDQLKSSALSLVARLRGAPALQSAKFFSEFWNSL